MSTDQWSLTVSILSLLATLSMWYYMYRNDNNVKVKVFPDPINSVQAYVFSGNTVAAIDVRAVTQNIGRQGVVITDVFVLESHDTEGSLRSRINGHLPSTLQTGEFISHKYSRAIVPDAPASLGSWPGFTPNINRIVALDSMGRKWDMKKEDIETINAKINEKINSYI